MTNLWVLIAIVMTFPIMQTNCHVGKTGVNHGLVTDPLLNDSDGIKLIHADAHEFSSNPDLRR